VLDQRSRRLQAALGFVTLRAAPQHPALATVHGRLDSWHGVGDVVAGIHRQGYDVQMAQDDERGWRATFYVSRMEHSASVTASAFEDTPWCAAQRAAREAQR
jgi:hypothetical protein